MVLNIKERKVITNRHFDRLLTYVHFALTKLQSDNKSNCCFIYWTVPMARGLQQIRRLLSLAVAGAVVPRRSAVLSSALHRRTSALYCCRNFCPQFISFSIRDVTILILGALFYVKSWCYITVRNILVTTSKYLQK